MNVILLPGITTMLLQIMDRLFIIQLIMVLVGSNRQLAICVVLGLMIMEFFMPLWMY